MRTMKMTKISTTMLPDDIDPDDDNDGILDDDDKDDDNDGVPDDIDNDDDNDGVPDDEEDDDADDDDDHPVSLARLPLGQRPTLCPVTCPAPRPSFTGGCGPW